MILVLHFVHELEYAAYGFFAALDSSLLFDTPVLPRVADLEPLAFEEAGDP